MVATEQQSEMYYSKHIKIRKLVASRYDFKSKDIDHFYEDVNISAMTVYQGNQDI